MYLVGPERPDGPVVVLGGEGDVEELVVVPDVGEGVAHAALEVLPGDVVVLRGAHGGGGGGLRAALGRSRSSELVRDPLLARGASDDEFDEMR